MSVLRTPDDRFTNLPGFPWQPHYVTGLRGFEGLRMHYLDEGPHGASRTYLCLHGEPTWAYLFRRMIPPFLASGARVVAPDLFGFGRSDKPVDDPWYTFSRHRDTLLAFIESLDLSNITLVVQDWGGLLGLTLPHAMPARFNGLLVMNTMFGTGDRPLTQGFLDWRAWVAKNPDLAVGKLMKRTCPHLTEAEVAAYDAPYPDRTFKAGARRFPELVPDRPDADGAAISRAACAWFQNEWRGQTFMAVGATDPVLGPPVMNVLRGLIRGCPEPMIVDQAGHFVQEWGEEIATRAVAAFRAG